jgi:hypothetical protein
MISDKFDEHAALIALLRARPDGLSWPEIEISKQLIRTQYEEIAGRPLADTLAPSQRPSDGVLKELWQNFQWAENKQ